MDYSKIPKVSEQKQLISEMNKRIKSSKCPHCGVKQNLDERKRKFAERIAENKATYPRDMLKEFYDYWTEISDNGRKMRFEKEKVFQVSRRLLTWDKRRKVKHESFQERDDRRLRESFERTEQLRHLPPFPLSGGSTKTLDKQEPLNWGNIIEG